MFAYVKNKFVDYNQAFIHIDERGFKFGDGIFDTIIVNNYNLYQWDFHHNRIVKGLKSIKLKGDISGLKQIATKLLRKNKLANGLIRLSISRGVGSQGYLPETTKPTIVMQAMSAPELNSQMANLFLSNYRRIPSCCIPVSAKTMQGLCSTLARTEAVENDCYDALQLSINDKIAECSSSNIFWFKDGKLYTPSLKCDILPGSIRSAVIRLSPWPVIQGEFLIDHLQNAVEIFITNVAVKALSVKRIKPLNKIYTHTEVATKINSLLQLDIEEATRGKN
jgi:branched-chain amino acid aminotransferase